MAAVVQAVRNPLYDFPVITTSAGATVQRNRTLYPPINPGATYGNNASSGGSILNTTVFDLMDSKRFLLTKNLVLQGYLIPEFVKDSVRNLAYPEGTAPCVDQSLQALAARIRIGTQQGHVIEEVFAYGLLSNVLESFSETPAHKEFSLIDHSSLRWTGTLPFYKGVKSEWLDEPKYAYDGNSRLSDNIGRLNPSTLVRDDTRATITGSTTANSQARLIEFSLHHSSFLNSVGCLPLKLFNQALRIEIEWQDARFCYYNNHMGVPPQRIIDISAIALSQANIAIGGGINTLGFNVGRGGFSLNIRRELLSALSDSKAAFDDTYSAEIGDIPAGFLLFTKNGMPVTIAYTSGNMLAVAAGGGAVDRQALTLQSESGAANATVSGPFALVADHANGVYTVKEELAALQRIYGCRPMGGSDGTTITRGVFVPAGTAAADGTTTVATWGALSAIADTIWWMPTSVAPLTFANNINAPSMACAEQAGAPRWQYAFQNLNMLVDEVLPADPVRSAYQQAYMMPEGISYPFTRVLYQNFVSQSPPASGWQQYQITARVKSLRGILCVMTDELWNLNSSGTDYATYNAPWMSSFLSKGISQAYLQVGGEQFPQSRIFMDTNMIEVAQLPELYTMMDTSIGSNGAIPTFPIHKLHREGRNYGKAGTFSGNPATVVPYVLDQTQSRVAQTDSRTGVTGTSYVDTSKFILGFNTAKGDGRTNFMGGIDVSSAGSCVLNIQSQGWGVRRYVLHVFAFCDAVFSLQESQSVVRM